MTRLRTMLLALPVALGLAGGGALWAGSATRRVAAADIARPNPPRSVRIIAPGHVEPERDAVKLAFEAQGRIASIDVDEGVAVKAGQVLARLDDRLARARVAAAAAAVAHAQARFALARRGPRGEDLAAARAEAEAAEAAAMHRQGERVRSEQLGKTGAVASSVVDADEAAARVATAQAAAARARFQSLARGTRIEQLDEVAALLAGARAELEAAHVALDLTMLRAPSDGIILRRTAEVGQLVTLMAPAPIVTLADLRFLEVRAEIDEADVAAVAPGQLAYITVDAYGDRKLPIRITRISQELGRRNVRDDDPRARIDTRVLEVIATFEGPPDIQLPLGLRVSVHLGE